MSQQLARRRTRQIVNLFYRMMATWLWTEKVRLRSAVTPEERDRLRRAMWTRLGTRYREAAIAMGGLTIKVGQILSARSDIFPTEFTSQLSSLQDEVPGVPFAAIQGVIESEFGKPLGEIYASFDAEPLAAASLGQVHRARLAGGEEVVVKVLRPGVDTLIRADLEGFRIVIRLLMRWTRWSKDFDMANLYWECYRILNRELDLQEEARHTRRFGRMFEGEPQIRVPKVYDAFSRQRVLTLSYMPGLKLSDKEGMAEAGIAPGEVAALLTRALSRQILTEGFYHADPHPGNLLVQPGPVLVMLDFGMVGQLTPRHRKAFKRMGLGFLQGDPDAILLGLEEIEMLRPSADRLALRGMIAWILEKHMTGNIFELRPEDFLEVAREIRQIFYSQAFQFPADIAFLGRGTSITLGVCRVLDPEGDFMKLLEASTREFVDPGKETARTVAELAGDLSRLPARLDRVLRVMESGSRPGRIEAAPKRDHRFVSLGTAGVAFLGGNQFLLAGYEGVAGGCWVLSLVAVVWAIVQSLPPVPREP